MDTPAGLTQQDIHHAVERVADRLCRKMAFGIHTPEDIRQEVWLLALDCLSRYDPSRPFENFLSVHAKNRLLNLKRDQFMRTDPPCLDCHSGQPCKDGSFCRKYQLWRRRNLAKASLMCPQDLAKSQRCLANDRPTDCVELNEMNTKIDTELPVPLRKTFLKMRDGVRVPKGKRDAVERAVRRILKGVL